VDATVYQNAVSLGAEMLCLFSMTIAQAQRANGGNSLEAPAHLQTDVLSRTEGWRPFGGAQEGAYALTQAFDNLGITNPNIITHQWIQNRPGWIAPNPNAPVPAQTVLGIITLAEFFNSFVPPNGVIIADNNLSVPYQMSKNFGTNWRTQGPVTHIQQVRMLPGPNAAESWTNIV
jgi:hypothetical protein